MTTKEADDLVRAMVAAGAVVERNDNPFLLRKYSVVHYNLTLDRNMVSITVCPKEVYFFFKGEEGLFLTAVNGKEFNVLLGDDVWGLLERTIKNQEDKKKEAAIAAVYESINHRNPAPGEQSPGSDEKGAEMNHGRRPD